MDENSKELAPTTGNSPSKRDTIFDTATDIYLYCSLGLWLLFLLGLLALIFFWVLKNLAASLL